MNHEQKIKYLDIACRISRFSLKERDMDLIVSMYEMVLDKKGKGTIEDALNVMDEVDKREAERKKLL